VGGGCEVSVEDRSPVIDASDVSVVPTTGRSGNDRPEAVVTVGVVAVVDTVVVEAVVDAMDAIPAKVVPFNRLWLTLVISKYSGSEMFRYRFRRYFGYADTAIAGSELVVVGPKLYALVVSLPLLASGR